MRARLQAENDVECSWRSAQSINARRVRSSMAVVRSQIGEDVALDTTLLSAVAHEGAHPSLALEEQCWSRVQAVDSPSNGSDRHDGTTVNTGPRGLYICRRLTKKGGVRRRALDGNGGPAALTLSITLNSEKLSQFVICACDNNNKSHDAYRTRRGTALALPWSASHS